MGLINLYKIGKLYKLITHPKLESSKYWTEVFITALEIKEVREMLQGYKTYIIAILCGVVTVAKMLGYIDDATYNTLMALLASGGIATVAAKINRLNKY